MVYQVGLFIPCYMDAFEPEVGIATLELLERLGCTVDYPFDQTCCGQPMVNTGCHHEAAATEKLLVATVDRKGDQLAIKFYDDTPLGPDKLVKLIRKRRGMRLDPTGLLWVEWKGYQGGPMGAVRNVLLQLQS